jgi:type III secretory pathway component EscS
MNFDLRLPIGILFTLFGVILTIFGALTHGDVQLYEKSLAFNINLIWGVVMLIFGGTMLTFALRSRGK